MAITRDDFGDDDFGGEYPFRGYFLHLPAAGTIESSSTAKTTSEASTDDASSLQPVRMHTAEPVRMHFLDEGPRDAPPLLFVHGNPTWSFAWRRLVRTFSDRFRCIAVDHVGCGRSDKPPRQGEAETGGYPYVLAQHRNNLQTLVETLDLTDITLIAHDWGGAIGCAAAGRMAQRFAALVLMNTAAFPSPRMPFRIGVCRWPIVGPYGVRKLNAFARAATTMAVEQPLSETIKAGYLAPYDSWANRVAIQAFVDDIPMRPDHPSWADLVECERNLANLGSKRVLLPWGERDWCFTPWFRDEFVKRFPAAIVQPYPDAGHYVFEDAADELEVVLKTFLRG